MPFHNNVLRPFKFLERRYAGHPGRVFLATVKLTLAFHVFQEFGYIATPTIGPSMLPTLEVLGDWVLISRKYSRGRGIEVGDMVTFDSVVEPGEKVIKRVLGLEGDFVLRDTPESGSDEMIQVPQGHCWVVGDNLQYSRDSRHFGPIPMALIKGKVIAKIIPWKERRWMVNDLQ